MIIVIFIIVKYSLIVIRDFETEKRYERLGIYENYGTAIRIQICPITKLVTPLFRMDIHIDIITATTATFSYAVNVFHNHLLCP